MGTDTSLIKKERQVHVLASPCQREGLGQLLFLVQTKSQRPWWAFTLASSRAPAFHPTWAPHLPSPTVCDSSLTWWVSRHYRQQRQFNETGHQELSWPYDLCDQRQSSYPF